MSKRLKIVIAVILFIAALPWMCFVGILEYDFVLDRLPDYVKDSDVPKGYVKTDGESFVFRDVYEWNWYLYERAPDFPDTYRQVSAEDVPVLKNAIKVFDHTFEIKSMGSLQAQDLVNEGDRLILTFYDNDGHKTQVPSKDDCQLYFYDKETNILFYIHYRW